MAINNRIYSDLDLTFLRTPATGDVAMKYNEQAVIRSVRNLISTNRYERLFQPEIGSTNLIEDEIVRMITNYEPRATINQVIVSASPDSNQFNVSLYLLIGNQTTPTAINLILTRTR